MEQSAITAFATKTKVPKTHSHATVQKEKQLQQDAVSYATHAAATNTFVQTEWTNEEDFVATDGVDKTDRDDTGDAVNTLKPCSLNNATGTEMNPQACVQSTLHFQLRSVDLMLSVSSIGDTKRNGLRKQRDAIIRRLRTCKQD